MAILSKIVRLHLVKKVNWSVETKKLTQVGSVSQNNPRRYCVTFPCLFPEEGSLHKYPDPVNEVVLLLIILSINGSSVKPIQSSNNLLIKLGHEQVATLTGHSLRVLYLAMSPDGQVCENFLSIL